MRRWNEGLPAGEPKAIGGRPCTIWLDLFALCHAHDDGAWRRMEWPDGAPLLAQPWLQTAVFRVIGDELVRIRNEVLAARRRALQVG